MGIYIYIYRAVADLTAFSYENEMQAIIQVPMRRPHALVFL